MQPLIRGRLVAREACGPADIARAQALRALAFGTPEPDRDAHDALCTHILIEDGATLVACFRLLPLTGAGIAQSYSAQFYDLSALAGFGGPMVELGRFCLHPGHHDPDILRLAWGAMTAHVDARGVELLFGCSSFRGTEAADYADSFALLRQNHLAPDRWRPRAKAPQVVAFDSRAPDMRRAVAMMPPLLRTYLLMGGWVSDHAVVDRRMNTLHVFTGLEIARIPPARARLLREIAG